MKQPTLLERRGPLGVPYALMILLAFFFCLPAAFRAARLSLSQKENNVKDWLPSDFTETAELEWFAQHFAGESFVLATWEGCTVEDQRLTLLASKLLHESDSYDPSVDFPPELAATYRRAKTVGNELGLLRTGDDHLNWGGREEKWLTTPTGQWYYITPDGNLYRWEESISGPAALVRSVRRASGSFELDGTFVTAFGKEPGESPGQRLANPFYSDLSLLTATLFHTVQTGETIVAELASEGGPLWPIDLTDKDNRAKVAQRLAMERLTGSLFAPAVPHGFTWTPQGFRDALSEKRRDELPADFDFIAAETLQKHLDDRYNGSLEELVQSPDEAQADAWYAVWDAAAVEPPHRLTCVLVTLTDVAKDNLGYAIGRGVLGQPRGRLLQLAADSGLTPSLPPSLAPPPFNTPPPETIGGAPALRMGGPPVDNMAIDEEGSVTLVRLVGYSVLVGVLLSYFCFRSVKITLMIFIVGGSAAMLSMAMVWWTGGKVDAILLSMPSLVYVLGLSGAIHVVNYYRDEIRSRGPQGAAGRALRHAILPCTLASLTTAIGLASLVTSNLAPISNFGMYAAIGVMATIGILFSYLPAALQTFAPEVSDGKQSDQSELAAESPISEWWANFGRVITTHHRLVVAGCLALLIVCGVGLRHIKTSVQLLKLFDPESRIIHDYAWLEDNFGKLVPMELVVRMPPSVQAENPRSISAKTGKEVAPLDILQRVEAVSRIRQVVQRTLGEPGFGIVGQTTGSDTFLPPLPESDNRYGYARSLVKKRLLASSELLRDNEYLQLEKHGKYAGSELWRISLKVAALSDVDYGQFISTLRTSVEPVMRAYETHDVIMNQLAEAKSAGEPSTAPLLIIGAARPKSLEQTPLVSEDRTEILSHNAYVATLGELLDGEPIKTPSWYDFTPLQASELLQSDRWAKILDKYETVVWLGGEGFTVDDFRDAKHFVNAAEIEGKQVFASLAPGQIPDVEGSGPIQVIYTGVIPVVYKAQRTLLVSLADSIAMAFGLIWLVMVVLLNPGRGIRGWFKGRSLINGITAGAVAMIPNIFPLVTVFGLMCHFEIEIDIGTMMTASVAMGVAVDDTIHFLSWFRDNLDRGLSRVDAIIETYRRVGPAMTQTTFVGGLGLFVFALSTFTPTQRFGTLMLVMLGAALIGDLIMLPALLASPLGRFFKPRRDADGLPIKSATTQPTTSQSPTDVDDRITAAAAVYTESPVEGRPRLDRQRSGGSAPTKSHLSSDHDSRSRR